MIVRQLLVKLSFSSDINKLLKFNRKIDDLRGTVIKLSAALGLATAAVGYFVKEAAKLEQTRIAFQVMTNSVEIGNKLLKDLYTFARTTPFRLPGVLESTRNLLGMGVTANEMVDVLTMIGEVSAGLNKPLSVLANIFGKVRSVGHLTGFEMERLRRAGVPLSEFLAKALGTDIPGMLHAIRKKQVSFAVFEEAWMNMVEDRFSGLMQKLLGTFLGMVSNIKDYIFEIVTFSGEALLPAMKVWAKQLLYILDTSKKLIETNLKLFFTDLGKVIISLNKHFGRFIASSRESIYFFGGMKKALTALGIVLGIYFGGNTLKILGWLFKSTVSFLSVGSIKLMAFAAGMILILGLLGDIFETLTTGRRTITRDFLKMLEKDFPRAFEVTMKWIKFLKKEIEGLSLMLIGILTMDKDMISAGAYQVLEAYRMARDKNASKEAMKKAAIASMSVEKGLPGTVGALARGMGIGELHGRSEEEIRSMYPITASISDFMWKMKNMVDETFAPGGQYKEVKLPEWMRGTKEQKPLMRIERRSKEDLLNDFSIAIEALANAKNVLGTNILNPPVAKLPFGPGVIEKIQKRGQQLNNYYTTINVEKLPPNADIEDFKRNVDKSIRDAIEENNAKERRAAASNITTIEYLGQ